MDTPVDLYNHSYGQFGHSASEAVRAQTYGQDIGQSSWMSAAEWLHFAEQVEVGPDSNVLEVGSGSGGPAVYLAKQLGCQVTGVDINEHGVSNAIALAEANGVSARTRFQVVDAGRSLPFADGSFDAVLSNDAMCHIGAREDVLRDWHRILRPGGRMLFSDALVINGMVSNDELAARTSIGHYICVPPGLNEELIRRAGFELLGVEDLTESAANIAMRWHDARERHHAPLAAIESEANFQGLQKMLASVELLSRERRLLRLAYLARRP